MNKKRTTITAILGLIFIFTLVGTTAEAGSVLRAGESVSIAEDQTVDGDFYGMTAKSVNMSGAVTDDMLVIAKQITLNGSVGADAFLVGEKIDMHGVISDDLRVLGMEVTIAKPVNGDLFVVGGIVTVLSSASVTGDVIVYGGEVILEGPVGGNVYGKVESLRIDAQVAGSVEVSANELVLGDKAIIDGSLRYTSLNTLTQALGATVSGELVRNDPVMSTATNSTFRNALLPALILLFSTLAWYWISQKTLRKFTNRALLLSVRPILLGLAVILFTPLVIGMLVVSQVGLLLGLILLFSYLLFFLLGLISLPAVIGELLYRSYNRQSEHISLISLIIGVVAIIALLLLPPIGYIALLICMVMSMGSLFDLLIRPTLPSEEEIKKA